MSHVIICWGLLNFCRKQSDGDDSDEDEVVKRPKAVCVHLFPVIVPTCTSIFVDLLHILCCLCISIFLVMSLTCILWFFFGFMISHCQPGIRWNRRSWKLCMLRDVHELTFGCRRFNQLQVEVEAEDVVEAEAEEEGQMGLQVHVPTGLRKQKILKMQKWIQAHHPLTKQM